MSVKKKMETNMAKANYINPESWVDLTTPPIILYHIDSTNIKCDK